MDPWGLYTVYWGGAGLATQSPYIADQVQALSSVGLRNVRHSTNGGGSAASWNPDFIKNNLPLILDANAVLNLRSYPPPYGYLTPQAPYDPDPEKGKTQCPEQTNYIGYSYGSLLAAQTAMYYATRG